MNHLLSNWNPGGRDTVRVAWNGSYCGVLRPQMKQIPLTVREKLNWVHAGANSHWQSLGISLGLPHEETLDLLTRSLSSLSLPSVSTNRMYLVPDKWI